MEPFTHYKLKETEDGIEIILYIDQNVTEFSDELENVPHYKETTIKEEAMSFVKTKFPTLKVKSVKVMAGAILLTSLGLATLPANQVSALESTTEKQSQNVASTYTVTKGDTLYSIATRNGTTVDAIKQTNNLPSNTLQIGQSLTISTYGAFSPVQINTSTTYQVVSGDTLYSIATRTGTTVDAIKQANNLSSNTLQIGQTLTISTYSASAPVQTNKPTTHLVISGDTLFNIATQNGTTVDAIKQANNLSSNTLQIGQTLTIPTNGATASPVQTSTPTTTHQVVSGDTLYSIAARNGTTADAIKEANNLSSNTLQIGQTLTIPTNGTSASPVKTSTPTTTHQVVSGDTLYSIATRNGTTADAIKQANNLSSNTLQIGQTLTIPSGTSPATGNTTIASPTQTEQKSEFNQEEVEWLAKMIYSEGRGESIEGQIAIGAVIMNRVNSPLFPNNVKDVLFEKSYGYYQFTPAETGAINTAKPNAQNFEAAERALNGEDPTNGALFFYNPDKTSSTYLRSRTVSTVIGNHTFAF